MRPPVCTVVVVVVGPFVLAAGGLDGRMGLRAMWLKMVMITMLLLLVMMMMMMMVMALLRLLGLHLSLAALPFSGKALVAAGRQRHSHHQLVQQKQAGSCSHPCHVHHHPHHIQPPLLVQPIHKTQETEQEEGKMQQQKMQSSLGVSLSMTMEMMMVEVALVACWFQCAASVPLLLLGGG